MKIKKFIGILLDLLCAIVCLYAALFWVSSLTWMTILFVITGLILFYLINGLRLDILDRRRGPVPPTEQSGNGGSIASPTYDPLQVRKLMQDLVKVRPVVRQREAEYLNSSDETRIRTEDWFDDVDAPTRLAAAKALGQLPLVGADKVAALTYLKGRLIHIDWSESVRLAAKTSIEALGTPTFGEFIVALRHDLPDVRKAAVHGLGQTPNPTVVGALIEMLKDNDDEVRAAAAAELGQLHDVHVLQPLIKALRDPSSTVRSFSAEALENLGDARAIRPLKAALKKCTDETVRWCYRKALRKLGVN